MFRATCDGDRDELFRLMKNHGFVDSASQLTVDEAYEWWAMSAAAVLDDQPHTFVPADGTAMVQSIFDNGSLGSAVRKMNVPSDYLMISRINMGVHAILSELGAALDMRDHTDTLDGAAAPLGRAAKLHAHWAYERGLPFGLDER
jgi:hypothetical protein